MLAFSFSTTLLYEVRHPNKRLRLVISRYRFYYGEVADEHLLEIHLGRSLQSLPSGRRRPVEQLSAICVVRIDAAQITPLVLALAPWQNAVHRADQIANG